MDKSSQTSDAFRELCTSTELAVHATKANVQAISKAMAKMVMLEHHLWLNLMEIRDADKVTLPDFP